MGIRNKVRKAYGSIAKTGSSCCPSCSCCAGPDPAQDISRAIGYSDEEMSKVPAGANLGLGCGNPVGIASLKEGDTVIDLGSGAGFDVFLASAKVGKTGHVIGIDMTEEMVERARFNAKKGNYENVEFRMGEIENLPIEDNLADVVISNCVVNLSPDKGKVFKEAFRVLRPGGKIFISDLVLIRHLPEILRRSVEAYIGCIAGASMKEDYLGYIRNAGFKGVDIISQAGFSIETILSGIIAGAVKENPEIKKSHIKNLGDLVVSISVKAEKPANI